MISIKIKHLQIYQKKDYEDIDNRRKLEFCQFMKNDKEIEALNNGLNILNINAMIPGKLLKKIALIFMLFQLLEEIL